MLRQLNINSKKLGKVEILSTDQGVTIKTSRLEFRLLSLESPKKLITHYTSLLCNPENMKMMSSPWSAADVRRFISIGIYNNECQHSAIFTVYFVNTDNFIGSIRYHYVKDKYRTVGCGHKNVFEMGYVLDKPYWGQGYGTEMARTTVKFIKKFVCPSYEDSQQPCPSEIVAIVDPRNEASIKILKKTLKSSEVSDVMTSDLFFFRPLKKDKGMSDTKDQSPPTQSSSI